MSRAHVAGRPWRELIIAVGMALGTPLAVGLLLDALFGWAPLMFFVGGSVGILAGTIVVVRSTLRRMKALSELPADVGSREAVSFGKEDRA